MNEDRNFIAENLEHTRSMVSALGICEERFQADAFGTFQIRRLHSEFAATRLVEAFRLQEKRELGSNLLEKARFMGLRRSRRSQTVDRWRPNKQIRLVHLFGPKLEVDCKFQTGFFRASGVRRRANLKSAQPFGCSPSGNRSLIRVISRIISVIR